MWLASANLCLATVAMGKDFSFVFLHMYPWTNPRSNHLLRQERSQDTGEFLTSCQNTVLRIKRSGVAGLPRPIRERTPSINTPFEDLETHFHTAMRWRWGQLGCCACVHMDGDQKMTYGNQFSPITMIIRLGGMCVYWISHLSGTEMVYFKNSYMRML